MFSKAGVVAVATAAIFAAAGIAGPPSGPAVSDVPTANPKTAGYAPASKLSPQLQQIARAQGSTKLENPDGIDVYYGYQDDGPMVPTTPGGTEAQKTEPDKNTYLVFKKGLTGADPGYDYGTHFLFQGHENGAGKNAYLTRINLDADAAHRVTRLAPTATVDGSTWDPWAQRLLLTTESTTKPTYAATPGYPSTVDDVSGALGRGGYEGIQNDSDGNLWIVEDIGGATKAGTTAAKMPNSFVFRYVPKTPGDLHNGRLQALQVLNEAGQPITFESQQPLNAGDQVQLHRYGNSLATKWITVHDTATDGTVPFNANQAAKDHHATPFKRPENGVFRPGTKFGEFFFTETGDTNADGEENDSAGGWGGIQRLTQSDPSADTGRLTVFYAGDRAHTGLDNLTFLSRDAVAVGEDAGDTLHEQRHALDSAFVFRVGGGPPVRWLAEGRDASATLDSANGGFGKNDQDNEITGIHVSDGEPGTNGLLGAREPNLFKDGWRWFYTQQHGDNVTYEVIAP